MTVDPVYFPEYFFTVMNHEPENLFKGKLVLGEIVKFQIKFIGLNPVDTAITKRGIITHSQMSKRGLDTGASCDFLFSAENSDRGMNNMKPDVGGGYLIISMPVNISIEKK